MGVVWKRQDKEWSHEEHVHWLDTFYEDLQPEVAIYKIITKWDQKPDLKFHKIWDSEEDQQNLGSLSPIKNPTFTKYYELIYENELNRNIYVKFNNWLFSTITEFFFLKND